MLQFFRKVWQRLWGRLRYCGAVHYLAGGPSLPPPLTPEQEKALLDCMAAGDAAAREELITHNLRLVRKRRRRLCVRAHRTVVSLQRLQGGCPLYGI